MLRAYLPQIIVRFQMHVTSVFGDGGVDGSELKIFFLQQLSTGESVFDGICLLGGPSASMKDTDMKCSRSRLVNEQQSNAYRVLLRYNRESRYRRIKKQRPYERERGISPMETSSYTYPDDLHQGFRPLKDSWCTSPTIRIY